jgi:hypothetical protein
MVCYAVPLAALLITAFRRKLLRKTGMEGFWLNLLLLGGALFGVIDHFWNGELFLLGPNLIADLSLGATITAGIFVSWGVIVFRERLTGSLKNLERKTGIYK